MDGWDASVLIYCDEHAKQPLGPVLYEQPPLRPGGAFFLGEWRRRTDHGPTPVWIPELILADSVGNTVWTRNPTQFLDAADQPIPMRGELHETADALDRAQQLAGLGEDGNVLDHPKVIIRHRNCRRALRLTQDRLAHLLDSLAAQGIRGVSLKYLELMNTRL